MTLPIFEPYRIKTVEPIQITTAAHRHRILQDVDFNLFRIPAELVMVDLLTDSGTGAMSSRQVAAMLNSDESYAGSASYFRLVEACERAFGFSNVLPTHQGRVAERLLVEAIIGAAPSGRGFIVPNNAHFDTTRRMIEASDAEAWNLLPSSALDPSHVSPFKGDIDVSALELLLRQRADDVPFVMLTVTCNSNGGQPVSLANIRAVRAVCDRFEKRLILDACRFAENAFFIKQRELAERKRSVHSIVREMFDLADGVVMSARKDGLANAGGLLMLRDRQLHQKAASLCVLTDGFQMSYGSLAGRDLETIAVGLHEAVDESYLASRLAAVESLGGQLLKAGVTVVQPIGGHAIYLDAEAFCPHLSSEDQPAHSLACAIYEHAGVRSTRIGSVLKNTVGEPMALVRLAIPRRLYSSSQLDYVAAAVIDLKHNAAAIPAVQSKANLAPASFEPEFQAA
jgi:tryptophanase